MRREHMNVVFIGHVDAGKSTTCGQILLLTVLPCAAAPMLQLCLRRALMRCRVQGGVDERTIQKYERCSRWGPAAAQLPGLRSARLQECCLPSSGHGQARCLAQPLSRHLRREARDNNRGSWYLAYILDTNEEERAKGKTVELARALFNTDKKRYTILDAPGHRTFVAEMIAGAAQADVGVLIISARQVGPFHWQRTRTCVMSQLSFAGWQEPGHLACRRTVMTCGGHACTAHQSASTRCYAWRPKAVQIVQGL